MIYPADTRFTTRDNTLDVLARQVRGYFADIHPAEAHSVTRYVGGLAASRLIFQQIGDGNYRISEQIDAEAFRQPWSDSMIDGPDFFSSALLTPENELVDIRPCNGALPFVYGRYIGSYLLDRARITSPVPLGWWRRFLLRNTISEPEL